MASASLLGGADDQAAEAGLRDLRRIARNVGAVPLEGEGGERDLVANVLDVTEQVARVGALGDQAQCPRLPAAAQSRIDDPPGVTGRGTFSGSRIR